MSDYYFVFAKLFIIMYYVYKLYCMQTSHLYKFVGLLSIKPIGQAEGIRSSRFVQFTHQFVGADMDVIVGLGMLQGLGNMDEDIITKIKEQEIFGVSAAGINPKSTCQSNNNS